MLIQGLVGAQQGSDNTNPQVRMDKQGGICASELNPRYYENTYRSRSYYVATQAVATTTVGLATTYTGLCLANPINSVANLILTKVTFMQSVIQATQVEAYAIAVGFNASTNVTLTTPATVQNALVGTTSTLTQAKAATSATLPTAPLYAAFIGATGTATADATFGVADLEGSIILPPGGYAAWVTPAQASVAGLWFSFQWVELPL